MSKTYLRELKETDPEKLREIRDKALETRRIKSDKVENFKDILKGELSICVYLKDKDGSLIKDKKGRLVEITKKELLALKVVDRVIENGTIKDLRELGEIIGDIDKQRESNVNVVFENLRNELLETEQPQYDDKKVEIV